MDADIRRTYWGEASKPEWSKETKKLYGCVDDSQISEEVMKVLMFFDAEEEASRTTARGDDCPDSEKNIPQDGFP